jgi:hypothetical protein
VTEAVEKSVHCCSGYNGGVEVFSDKGNKEIIPTNREEGQVKSVKWEVDLVRCIGAMEEQVNTERESIAALLKAIAVKKPEVG